MKRDSLYQSFDRSMSPAATVQPGEPFVVETVHSSVQATGPIAVRGVVPGEALAISIEKIELLPDTKMWIKPGRGAFGDYLAGTIRDTVVKPVPLWGGSLGFSKSISIPLRPMIGVLGLAPYGDPVPTYWPGQHGGNLDCRLVTTGSTLYLPVATPGALLGVGDLHAAMGDGEVMLSGVEAAGEVTLRVDRVPDWPFTGPWVETADDWVALGSARNLDAALDVALKQMVGLLTARAGLRFEEAGMLCSAAADAAICQVVNPKVTVRLALPKSLIPGLRLR